MLPACAREVESDTAGIRFFFMAFIVLGSWAMLSLLTGVMSEHMIEKSAARKAEMKEEAAERRKVRARKRPPRSPQTHTGATGSKRSSHSARANVRSFAPGPFLAAGQAKTSRAHGKPKTRRARHR